MASSFTATKIDSRDRFRYKVRRRQTLDFFLFMGYAFGSSADIDNKKGGHMNRSLNNIYDGFAELFGIPFCEIPKDCQELIFKFDFRCRALTTAERDRLLLRVLGRIDSPELRIAGTEGKERWVRGWQENLDNFVASNYDVASLVPKFIRPSQPVRLFGDYVLPYADTFELNFYTVFRSWLFQTYLADVPAVYEFGCGTAYNLVELARMYPEKVLHGLEWVQPPLEIIRLLRERFGYPMLGHLFDMFSPDKNLEIEPGSAFLAIGALEQLGVDFERFLEFVLEKNPSIFVHVDSITELYDENNLSDHLAFKHDVKRNYLRGYLTRLRELESAGRVEILKVQKVSCGGLYHDGYSFIIWRPAGGDHGSRT